MISLTMVLVAQSSVGFENIKWNITEIRIHSFCNIFLIDYFRVFVVDTCCITQAALKLS